MSRLVFHVIEKRAGRVALVFDVLAALGMMLMGATLIIAAIGFRAIGRDFMVRS